MMRRRSAVRLEGQVLFVEETRTHAVLDCVFARRGHPVSEPMTFVVRFPLGRTNKSLAKDLLYAWAATGVNVRARIADGRGGPEVHLSTDHATLVLEPEEPARRT